jgi:hypothetical protein
MENDLEPLVRRVKRLLKMKKDDLTVRFNSEQSHYEISLKKIGEEWQIRLGLMPDALPFLWIKVKNMDYSSYEETVCGRGFGIEELIDQAEAHLGLDAAERQKRAAARNVQRSTKTENRHRLMEGLDRLLGGYRS